jgi:hypothetical protein
MPGKTKWKTYAGGEAKTHRSERAAYDFLIEWAKTADDGAKATVLEFSPGRDEWQTSERLQVLNGAINPA